MTVTLLFKGGPRDGGWRRLPSASIERGKHIVVDIRRHMYCSWKPWDLDEKIEMFYQGKRRKENGELDKAEPAGVE